MLLISASDVEAVLDPPSCIAAVERAFRLHGEGRAMPPAISGIHAGEGGFHVKSALLADEEGRGWFATKVNANFPANPVQRGLPTVQGAVLLFAAESGEPLALIDSATLTAARTAAATAVAARALARPGSTRALLVGCGVQGRAHLAYLAAVLPLREVLLADPDAAAVATAVAIAQALGLRAEAVADPAAAAHRCDVVVTCTSARRPLLAAADVAPGSFVAGVGADAEHKHELAPDLLAASTVVADLLVQCERIGDLHHALAAGALRREGVHELGEVLAGRHPGRRGDDEVVVFDSTGMALQDVAAAAVVYRRAIAQGRGVAFALTPPPGR